MNGTSKILGFLILFMFLKAEKCSEQNENAAQDMLVNQMKKEIKSQFDADFLSEASLHEHGKAAKQKLADFADYLRILADSSLLRPYREKAGEMISNLFMSDTVRIKIISGHGRKDHEYSIGQLVQSGLQNELFISRILFDSVQVSRPFTPTGPDSYSAVLSFTEKILDRRDSTAAEASISRQINALITREYKIFASDTLSVWVLHLGKIE